MKAKLEPVMAVTEKMGYNFGRRINVIWLNEGYMLVTTPDVDNPQRRKAPLRASVPELWTYFDSAVAPLVCSR